MVRAFEDLRADNLMWSKRKLAALRRRKGVTASAFTAGRILRNLMDRGVVTPVPALHRNPAARRVRVNARAMRDDCRKA